jgi:uncharacterized membrane protein
MFDIFSLFSMISSLEFQDLLAVVIFLLTVSGYRLFLFLTYRYHHHRLTLCILQEYRTAWINSNGNNHNPIVVIQTLRNSLMSASFFASTAILLIGASVSLFNTMFPEVEKATLLQALPEFDKIQTVKVLFIISTLSYAFLHFTWYIREINNLAYMLTLPFKVIEKKIDIKASDHTAKLLEKAGIHYSMGMRGYYFTIALFLWFFGNSLLYISLFLIISSLIMRDLQPVANSIPPRQTKS